MDIASNLKIEILDYDNDTIRANYDITKTLFDLDSEIDLLSSKADNLDYLVSIGSGLLCGLLDILWVKDFDLISSREIASEKVNDFVIKSSKLVGFKGNNIVDAVRFLEKNFPIPSDGNTSDFGGGLNHHLNDFAHHPTVVGLIFSLLTQFTSNSYGTSSSGEFRIVPVPENSLYYMEKNIPEKIFCGTINWFFHLVSDMAGSSNTAGKSGGTGIPGPILSLAKELSVIPLFRNMQVGNESINNLITKLFNGKLLSKYSDDGSAIKLDFRGEVAGGIEMVRQAIPVLTNDFLVRSFYFLRHLAIEIKTKNIESFEEISKIDIDDIIPFNNPTISRMILIATGVFTTVDISEAMLTQNYFVSVNYMGILRFAVAIDEEISMGLKSRNLKKIRQMYETIDSNSFKKLDNDIYIRMGDDLMTNKFGLSLRQTEILYNLEYYKTLNDIENTKTLVNNNAIKALKKCWLDEWKEYITDGFSSFVQQEDAKINWYEIDELVDKIEKDNPENYWFRLVLLEVMLFEPYFPVATEQDKKGNYIPSKKYKELKNPMNSYKKSTGDSFLDLLFKEKYYYPEGYIKRLRKCYEKVIRELNEVLKTLINSLSIAAVVAVAAITTIGAFAPVIAVTLVGSNFVGLSGAALTSACLAYLGGGAVAVGGAGMLGGTIAIVGGGAILSVSSSIGIGTAVTVASLRGKQNTILQSAKLLVSMQEIFLNDENDIEYSNSIYEQYVDNIVSIEKGIVELRSSADDTSEEKKKQIKEEIKRAEESVEVMKIARKTMKKSINSFNIKKI